jgi:hypothetical protein
MPTRFFTRSTIWDDHYQVAGTRYLSNGMPRNARSPRRAGEVFAMTLDSGLGDS